MLLNGFVKKDRKQAKHILKQQREAWSGFPETSNLSQPFANDEIINAFKTTKAGKAGGPDGIFPDMSKDIGPAAVRWPQAFYDDVMTTAKIPKIYGDQQMRSRSGNLESLLMIPLATDRYHCYAVTISSWNVLLLTRLSADFLRASYHQSMPASGRIATRTCEQVIALTSHIESWFQK